MTVARGRVSYGSQSLEHRLSSCAAWAWLLHSVWNLPEVGIKLVPLALAGGLFTVEPRGKPQTFKKKLF